MPHSKFLVGEAVEKSLELACALVLRENQHKTRSAHTTFLQLVKNADADILLRIEAETEPPNVHACHSIPLQIPSPESTRTLRRI